jgi:hypothetical protein
MRSSALTIIACLSLGAQAQYGTIDAKAVSAAKAMTTLVVLDDGDSPYNRAVMDAVKAHWTFTATYDFIHVHDLAVAPVSADKVYLMKTVMTDPARYDMTYLAVVQGWKQKKGETLETKGTSFSNIPGEKILATIQCDPNWLADHDATTMYGIYVKNVQDYLKQVAAGKIIDKATADRTYGERNRTVKDQMKLWVVKEHLDKSVPNTGALRTVYTHPAEIVDLPKAMEAVASQDNSACVTDVILTGSKEKKHCFKRVFNCHTGELMYLRDDAALFGKKEGFIEEDLKQIERAR